MTSVKNSGKKKEVDVVDLINSVVVNEDNTHWEGTLKEYLPMVVEYPYLNETAHSRIWRMIETDGVGFKNDDVKKKEPIYKFFEHDLFGVDDTLADIMEYFKAAAAGSDVSRRILLLWGPTSSGKSNFAILIKRGLERFSRTFEGRVYALSESPMHENPLNAIPHHIRPMLKEKYGLVIDGDLSPKMAYLLENKYNGDFWKLPVKRVFFSEQSRVGIGTFAPADTKCLDGDSLILTDKGLLPIRELGENNEDSINVNIILPNGEKAEASKFFKYPKRETRTIKTNLGYNITGTLNHPLKTIDKNGEFKWMNIEDFNVDDILVLTKGQGDISFIRKEVENNPLDFTWSTNSAMFLGIYIAEGRVNGKYNVEITNYNEKIHDIIKEFCSDYNLNYTEYNERIIVYGKKLVDTMKQLGFTSGAHNKVIPYSAFTSGFIKELLIGMWLGDGNVGKHSIKNTNEAIYSTVSAIMANQVHLLLLAFGIPSCKTFDPKSGTRGAYKILISGKRVLDFLNLINIPKWKFTRDLYKNKVNSENIILMPSINTLVNDVCKSTKCMSKWVRYSTSNELSSRRFTQKSLKIFYDTAVKNGYENVQVLDKINEITNDKYLFLKITDIVSGVGDVYDIEVPQYHHFIANGFISHNSQSQSELVGSVNFSKLEEFGVESHPMAYNFDGELNVSNRGVVEFIEMLKLDPKFRYILLTLAQEKQIKVERFPLIHADLVTLGHTNEVEYNKFLANKTEEALHDRLWVIKFPYNLRIDDEVKIYEKLICSTPGFKQFHIAPHALKVAAMFAVLSRLEEPKDRSVTLLQKMHLYNGEHLDGFTKEAAKKLKKDAFREGQDGVSPRYIVNRLAACFSKHGVNSVTPIDALRSIKEGLTTNAKLDKDAIAKLENLISDCVVEYNKIACNDVQKAFFVNFEHEIKNLLENYIDNVGCYLNDSKVENEWGEFEEPNERLMRNIEEKIEITESGKDTFREEVYRKMLESKGNNGKHDYNSHPKLKEALQKQLFEERSDVIRLTVSSRNPDPEGLKKLNEVIRVLCDNYGYNEESANELLKYVSNIMSKTS